MLALAIKVTVSIQLLVPVGVNVPQTQLQSVLHTGGLWF